MSELRIRSEPPAADPWPEPWFPRAAQARGDTLDDSSFVDMCAHVAEALQGLFGLSFLVQPGRPLPHDAPAVAPELALLLGTVRLGGDPARAVLGTGGVTGARHTLAIAAALAPVAALHWPTEGERADIWLDCLHIADGRSLGGPVHLMAPERDALPPQQPPPGFAAHAMDLPMRLRIELSGEYLPLTALLPLRVGALLPISALPEMPVLLGDHCIGRASLLPLPDGRQQATFIAIAPHRHGDRA